MAYRAEVVEITPDMASRMLARNYEHNRNISPTYIDQLAMVMEDGRFDSENGQTITVGNDGVLYDGQQRLSAMIAANKTYRFIVAHIDDGEKKFSTMDRNRVRKTADFIFDKNSKSAAAIAKTMVCVDWGHAPLLSCIKGFILPNVHVDNSLVLDYYAANADDIQAAVRDADRMRRSAKLGAPSAYGTFIMCVRKYGDDSRLDEFIEDFVSATTSNAIVAKTKQTIMLNVRRGHNSPKTTLGVLLDGYEHFLTGKNVSVLRGTSVALARLDEDIQQARKRVAQDA